MLSLKHQQKVERTSLQLCIITFQHIKEIFGNRKIFLRMANMQRTAESSMAQHIICISNNGRELRNQFYALAHQVVAGSIIGNRVKTIHLKYTACQDIHNIIPFQFDNIHLGFLLQRHIIINQFTERSQLLLIGQITGQ